MHKTFFLFIRHHAPAALCAATFVALALPTTVGAEPSKPSAAPKIDITANLVPAGAVKIDGFVTDWEGVEQQDIRTLTRGEAEYDWTGPRDLSMLVQTQYDDKYLYMAIEIRDNLVTRPKGRGQPGDHVEIWFDGGPLAEAIKTRGQPGRLRMLRLLVGDIHDDGLPHAFWGYPGALKGRPEGILVDGSLRKTGYFFEVGIPLSEVSNPAPGLESIGMAIIARDWDYDDPKEDPAAVSTAPFDGIKARNPATMAKLTLSGATSVKNGFFKLVPAAAGKKVIGEQFADVGGDNRREWVFLVDNHYIAISGIGLGDGQYYYYELEGRDGGTYTSLEMRDLTGDGKAEFIVRYTYPEGQVTQEFLAIYHFALDRVKLVFFHEVGNKGPGWSVSNAVEFKSGKDKVDVIVASPSAKGATKANYIDVDEKSVVDWERIILPWEAGPKKRLFQWDTSQFLKRQ